MNIGLIGFQGSGKTRLARRLSHELDYTCVDTDELVELAYGKHLTCRQIFQKEGELFFRKLERSVLLGLNNKTGLIISFGGGSPLDLVKNISSVCLYLYLDYDAAFAKMLEKGGVFVSEAFMSFYKRRERGYADCADVRVDAQSEHVFDCTKEALGELVYGK